MHHLLNAAGVPHDQHIAVIELFLNIVLRLAFCSAALLLAGAAMTRRGGR